MGGGLRRGGRRGCIIRMTSDGVCGRAGGGCGCGCGRESNIKLMLQENEGQLPTPTRPTHNDHRLQRFTHEDASNVTTPIERNRTTFGARSCCQRYLWQQNLAPNATETLTYPGMVSESVRCQNLLPKVFGVTAIPR